MWTDLGHSGIVGEMEKLRHSTDAPEAIQQLNLGKDVQLEG
jgi:hypothetical protein